MGDDKKRDDIMEEGGPGQIFVNFVVMEELLDKLKLINYEREFCREFRMKPLNRHYFAVQTNPGEQFFMFTSLAAWLIRKCGKPFETPQEHDDPNSTISNILDILRQLGVAIDFSPSKLKQGFGEHAIYVLDRLADQALKDVHFQWKRPIHATEEEDEDAVVDDTAEITLEKVEEEMLAEDVYDDDDDDEGAILDLEELKGSSTKNENWEGNKPDEILESVSNIADWQLEVERILPQLKVTIHSDSKDWRTHLEQMHHYRKDIDESLTVTKSQLDKLYSDITRTLEKIGAREKYLNGQLEQLLLEYRAAQDQLAQAKEQYRSVSGGVTERSQELAQITEELEQVKQEMDERGSSMTDGTPLVNIRKALTRLKTEINQMDVRIGVAAHTLLQAKMKEKGNLQRAVHAPLVVGSIDAVF